MSVLTSPWALDFSDEFGADPPPNVWGSIRVLPGLLPPPIDPDAIPMPFPFQWVAYRDETIFAPTWDAYIWVTTSWTDEEEIPGPIPETGQLIGPVQFRLDLPSTIPNDDDIKINLFWSDENGYTLIRSYVFSGPHIPNDSVTIGPFYVENYWLGMSFYNTTDLEAWANAWKADYPTGELIPIGWIEPYYSGSN